MQFLGHQGRPSSALWPPLAGGGRVEQSSSGTRAKSAMTPGPLITGKNL